MILKNWSSLTFWVTSNYNKDNNLIIIQGFFWLKEPPYNLRSESNHFTRRNVKTTYYGLLSIKHLQSFAKNIGKIAQVKKKL